MQEIKFKEVEKDLPANIEQLNARMKNIEQVAQTVEAIAEKGFASIDTYFKNKAEQEKLDLELEDKQHKRAIIVLSTVIAVVFVLLMTAMVLKQYDLVKIILGSTLAVGGGAGIAGLFKRKSPK